MSEPAIQILPASQAPVMEFDWGSLTWYASRELGNARELTTGLCRLLPGHANPRHYHPNCEEILTVIEGRIEHTIRDRETAPMGPGDTVAIPANLWHQARNVGDSPALLHISFSSADRKTVGE